MNNIPAGMPTLTAGSHSPGDGEACIMEYVSVLAGEPWTDHPVCVHPFIAWVARGLNDLRSGEERQQMLALIPRLMATGSKDWEKYETPLRVWVVQHYTNGYYDGVTYSSPLATREISNGRGLGLLTGLLDEYERLTEATPIEVTEKQYQEATQQVTTTPTWTPITVHWAGTAWNLVLK